MPPPVYTTWRYRTPEAWERLIRHCQHEILDEEWELPWTETSVHIWQRVDTYDRCLRYCFTSYYETHWSWSVFEAWRFPLKHFRTRMEVVCVGEMITSLYLWHHRLTRMHMESPSV